MTALTTTQTAIDSYTAIFGEPPVKVNTLDTVRHGTEGFEVILSMSLGVTLVLKKDISKLTTLLATLPTVAGNDPLGTVSYANTNPHINICYCATPI